MGCPYCNWQDSARHKPLVGASLYLHILAKHPEQASTPVDTARQPVSTPVDTARQPVSTPVDTTRQPVSTGVDTPERRVAMATANPSPAPKWPRTVECIACGKDFESGGALFCLDCCKKAESGQHVPHWDEFPDDGPDEPPKKKSVPKFKCPMCGNPVTVEGQRCHSCITELAKERMASLNPAPRPASAMLEKTPAPPKKTPIPPKKPAKAFRKTYPDLPSREGHCMGCAKTPAPYMVKEAPNEKLCETCKDRAVKILANPKLKHSKDGGVSIKLLRHLLRFSPKKK